jgi:hypothetical protein
LRELSLERHKRREKAARGHWEEDWGLNIPVEEEEGPQGEIDTIEARLSEVKEIIEAKYSRLSFLAGALSILLVDFGAPLLVGAVAITNPEIISQLATETSSHES